MRDAWSSIVATANRAWDWVLGLPIAGKVGVGVGVLALALGVGAGSAAIFGGGTTTTTITTAPQVAPPTTSTTVAPTTTTAPTPTTTTTLPVGPGSVFNAIPAEDPTLLERRALAVKIDNHPRARPQSGISQADLVYELLVEGGLSRFIAVFHDNDSEYVGPIRSGRPTDPTLVRPTGGIMVYSGGQPWIQAIILNAGVPLIGEGEATFRIGNRSAPHNLYGNTTLMRAVAEARGLDNDPPPPFFEIGEFAGVEPAAQISTPWDAANRVLWTWDGAVYNRYTNELPHNEIDAEGNEMQITTDVVVVLTADRYTARPPDASGSAVPALETVGRGVAYVFADGFVAEGEWSRTDIAEPFTLTDNDGAPMMVPQGRPWVAVFPNSETVTWLVEPAP